MKPVVHPLISPNGIAWHALPEATVLALLVTDGDTGLTGAEAAARRAVLHGNSVRFSSLTWKFVVRQVHASIILLMAALALAAAFFQLWMDCLVLLALLGLNVGGALLLERRAKSVRAALRGRGSWRALALRSGRLKLVAARELVPGDVIAIKAGDIVPADARLLAADSLSCTETLLPRGNTPALKSPKAVAKDTPLNLRTSMIYMGTRVGAGGGRGVVVATGADTVVSMLAQPETLPAASVANPDKSPQGKPADHHESHSGQHLGRR
jgi:magnesium-transporting ATPase (P-type)